MNKSFFCRFFYNFKINNKSFIYKTIYIFLLAFLLLLSSNIIFNYWNYYSKKAANVLPYNYVIKDSAIDKESNIKKLLNEDENILEYYKENIYGYALIDNMKIKVVATEKIENDIELYYGRIPNNSNEIIVPLSFLRYSTSLDNKKIQLNIGYYYDNLGRKIPNHIIRNYGFDDFRIEITKEYNVVGIYKDSGYDPDFDVIFYTLYDNNLVGTNSIINYYVKLKKDYNVSYYLKLFDDNLANKDANEIYIGKTKEIINDGKYTSHYIQDNYISANIYSKVLFLLFIFTLLTFLLSFVISYYYIFYNYEYNKNKIYEILKSNNFTKRTIFLSVFFETMISFFISLIVNYILFKLIINNSSIIYNNSFAIINFNPLVFVLPLFININAIIIVMLFIADYIISNKLYFNYNLSNIRTVEINYKDREVNFKNLFSSIFSRHLKIIIALSTSILLIVLSISFIMKYYYLDNNMKYKDSVQIILNDDIENKAFIDKIKKMKNITEYSEVKRIDKEFFLNSSSINSYFSKYGDEENEVYFDSVYIYNIGEDFKKYTNKKCIIVDIHDMELEQFNDNSEVYLYSEINSNTNEAYDCDFYEVYDYSYGFNNIYSFNPILIVNDEEYNKYLEKYNLEKKYNSITITTNSYLNFMKEITMLIKKENVDIPYVIPNRAYIDKIIILNSINFYVMLSVGALFIITLLLINAIINVIINDNEKVFGILKICGLSDSQVNDIIKSEERIIDNSILIASIISFTLVTIFIVLIIENHSFLYFIILSSSEIVVCIILHITIKVLLDRKAKKINSKKIIELLK